MAPIATTLYYRAIPAEYRLSGADKTVLKEYAGALEEQLAKGESFVCLITSDAELQRLNNTFLGRDYPTDVLSFPAADGTSELGEMAISIERAKAQADEFGHGLVDELRILMLHGLLHLAGFDHEQDSGAMAAAERKWRRHFELPATLIERATGRTSGKRGTGKAR